MAKIWWLASYPKSGNTWLRLFLSAYRNGGSVNINEVYGASLDDIGVYFHQVVSPVPLDKLSEEAQMMLRPAALLHLCALQQLTQPLVVKTHFANCAVADIPAIPAVLTHGAVYIMRDPRDVALSFARHRDKPVDEIIEAMGRSDHLMRKGGLFHAPFTWSQHVSSWTGRAKFPVLALRFEDLLADPLAQFRRMLEFMHFEIDEDLLTRSIDATHFEALRAQEKARGFREAVNGEFFGFGRAGRWREELTAEQAAQIEADHGETMKRLDYL